MAGDTPSMQAMIDAGREKQKAERVAQQVFGRRPAAGTQKGRRGGQAAPAIRGSLAARVGVTKRSSSAAPKLAPNVDGHWIHDLHHINNPKALSTETERRYHSYSRMGRELSPEKPGARLNIRRTASGPSMSIRGIASGGPWVVVASNFAPGTTAEDIQAAMEPVGGAVSSCILISSIPTVMAELVFQNKDGAENVIATFNNQTADGRVIYVHMKSGGPSPQLHPLQHKQPASAQAPRFRVPSPPVVPTPQAPLGSRDRYDPPSSDRDHERDLMDVDDDSARSNARQQRPDTNGDRYSRGRAEPRSYRGGYDRRGGSGRGYGGQRLYSDSILGGRNGNGYR